MENEIQIFESKEFGKIRVITINDNIAFIAKDVAEIIDITWKGMATISHIPEEWKGITSGGTTNVNKEIGYLTEEGLNFFLFRSDKQKALPFQKWLAGTVLPSIRKHGGYIAQQEKMSDTELLARAVLTAQNVIAEKERQLEEAIKTKAYISDKKTATAMANSAVKTKQLKKITKEKEALQKKLDEFSGYATITAIQNLRKDLEISYKKLKDYCERQQLEIIKVVDKRYGQVNSYPAKAWEDVYNVDLFKVYNS